MTSQKKLVLRFGGGVLLSAAMLALVHLADSARNNFSYRIGMTIMLVSIGGLGLVMADREEFLVLRKLFRHPVRNFLPWSRAYKEYRSLHAWGKVDDSHGRIPALLAELHRRRPTRTARARR